MFHATFVALVESLSIPCDLSHATKISANTYDTLRDLLHSVYRTTSNLSEVSNYSASVMNYIFTSNSIIHVNNLEYFLL